MGQIRIFTARHSSTCVIHLSHNKIYYDYFKPIAGGSAVYAGYCCVYMGAICVKILIYTPEGQ